MHKLLLLFVPLFLLACSKDDNNEEKNILVGTEWVSEDSFSIDGVDYDCIYTLKFTSNTKVIFSQKEINKKLPTYKYNFRYIFDDPRITIEKFVGDFILEENRIINEYGSPVYLKK